MKTSPMIFNSEMVRALLDGQKSQTRRPVKPQPEPATSHPDCSLDLSRPGQGRFREVWSTPSSSGRCHSDMGRMHVSPSGAAGDLIYVRETTEVDEHATAHAVLSRYAVDKQPVLYSGCEDPEYNGSVAHWNYPRPVRPSVHMFRWASRLTLKITDVCIERVQDIRAEDCLCEGIKLRWMHRYADREIKSKFSDLWNSIYSNWESNPWVWVYEFEVIKQNVDDYLNEKVVEA